MGRITQAGRESTLETDRRHNEDASEKYQRHIGEMARFSVRFVFGEILFVLVTGVMMAPVIEDMGEIREVCQYQVDRDGLYHEIGCVKGDTCISLPESPPESNIQSLESWITTTITDVKHTEHTENREDIKDNTTKIRTQLCSKTEYPRPNLPSFFTSSSTFSSTSFSTSSSTFSSTPFSISSSTSSSTFSSTSFSTSSSTSSFASSPISSSTSSSASFSTSPSTPSSP